MTDPIETGESELGDGPRGERGDAFYSFVCFVGRPVFWLVSRPVVLHPERSAAPGGFLLASNHLSPYDVACLMYTTRRHIDFVSIVELFQNRLVAWFFDSLNAMPLDRGRRDSTTVRRVIDRLRSGRVVGIFPEGGLQTPETSVLTSGRFRPGIGRMARMADVPVVPVVILDTGIFSRFWSWLPLRRTRFAVAYGEPIHAPARLDDRDAQRFVEQRWRESERALLEELLEVYRPSSEWPSFDDD